jgi:rSAM/selenodomain-associated transferase 1
MMTKAPRAGEVKTRLVPPLTHSEAAELSLCLLRDTIANMTQVAARAPVDLIAVYSPSTSEKEFDGLLPDNFSLLSQSTGPLGDRLFDATCALLSAGYAAVLMIGSDSPTLPTEILLNAVEALGQPGDRIVLGPADDGGYYLIGLKRPHRCIFQGIEWSTDRVLRQTIARAEEAGIEIQILPAWYDLDDARSLSRACQELLSSNHLSSSEMSSSQMSSSQMSSSHDGECAAPHTRDCLERLISTHGRERIWPAALPG